MAQRLKFVVTARRILRPGPHHSLEISSWARPVTVTRRDGTRIARVLVGAKRVREADFGLVYYVPRPAVGYRGLDRRPRVTLTPSPTRTWSPYKGEAQHFNLVFDDGLVIEDAAWSYHAPLPPAAALHGLVAFYPKLLSIESA